ncbi:SET domain protein [Vararia minispora EC-137]|uniref:SET domain protein n=1 Tax=Vararia minispora EC-137 TaxID=1314806 RepID=A0ACB8QTX5_9AGAM|nr:SET domain protein [Vararia minispora EC-137]
MYPEGKCRLPKNWPDNVRFTQSLHYHSSVTPAILAFLRRARHSIGTGSGLDTHAPCIIKKIHETGHPACGQSGLFALRKIPAKAHIIDYIGEVHCDDRPTSNYDISLYRFQDGVSVGVDAAAMGNEARFCNDYRGVRMRPNAEFRDRRTETEELRIGIWSTEDIRKGDEILVSYGKSWWAGRTSAVPETAVRARNEGEYDCPEERCITH